MASRALAPLTSASQDARGIVLMRAAALGQGDSGNVEEAAC
jgi:hypothetical protein